MARPRPTPLLWALLLLALLYVPILGRRVVPAHDTLQVAQVVYDFFNGWVQDGEIPLWFPCYSYGAVANWYLAITMGPSFCMLLPLAGWIPGPNFMSWFYAGMLLDEMFLLLGTYLLARRLFRSDWAVFFVCAAMVGSTIWFAQIWFNFRIYYFFPLAMHAMWTGCERASLWRVLAGGAVLLWTAFGNLFYYPILHALACGVFLVGTSFAHRMRWVEALRRSGWREGIVCCLAAVPAAAYFAFLKRGVDFVSVTGRGTGGRTSIEDFLTYAGTGLNRLSDLVTGMAWTGEYNGYAGILVLCLAVSGFVLFPQRKQVPFLLLAGFLVLFSLGCDSFVSPAAYFVPGVSFFRHIGCILPLFKICLIFLAGFGVEGIASATAEGTATGWTRRKALVPVAILLLMSTGCALLALADRKAPPCVEPFYHLPRHAAQRFSAHHRTFGTPEHDRRSWPVAAAYVAALSAFAIAAFRPERCRRLLLASVAGIELLDVAAFRVSMGASFLRPVGRDVWELSAFRRIPFQEERTKSYGESAAFRAYARDLLAEGTLESIRSSLRKGVQHYYFCQIRREGMSYNTADIFLGIDPIWTLFRIDYWHSGVDALVRAFHGPPNDWRYAFPVSEGVSAYDKVIGAAFPKIQAFSEVGVLPDEKGVGAILRDEGFAGDALLAEDGAWRAFAGSWGGALPPHARLGAGGSNAADPRMDRRIELCAKALHFSANRLELEVETPADGAGSPRWLYYADTAHPFWRAYVDGAEAPILRANLAFKAVPIPPGRSIVRFVYGDPILQGTGAAAALACGGGGLGLAIWTILLLWRREERG